MTAQKNDGGPAFPTENERQVGPSSYHYEGMSLRDWFAGQALAMLRRGDANNARGIAELAYEIADAMLAQRAGCFEGSR